MNPITERVFFATVVAILLTQVVIPLILGAPMFFLFRRRTTHRYPHHVHTRTPGGNMTAHETYKYVDQAILAAVKAGKNRFNLICKDEVVAGLLKDDQEPGRTLDRRLQALSKRRLISFSKTGEGWVKL